MSVISEYWLGPTPLATLATPLATLATPLATLATPLALEPFFSWSSFLAGVAVYIIKSQGSGPMGSHYSMRHFTTSIAIGYQASRRTWNP